MAWHRVVRNCQFYATPLLFATILSWVAPSTAYGVGESVNGFPNWAERVIHAWINRSRVDPQTEMTACGANCGEKACYSPVNPLPWDLGLNRAARFHSDEMLRQNYFAHASACTVVSNINSIYPDSCDGSASCACTTGVKGCPCSSTFDRIKLFSPSGTSWGEIIASPSDPNQAFYLWLYEPSSSTTCASNSLNGHRWTILKWSGMVGIGVSGLSTGDFRSGGTLTKIPSGSHYPRQAASVNMWTNWFDSAAPSSANVNVDGECFAMTLGRGTATNGAYRATVSGFGSGCHRYYFQFVDSQGNVVTFPTTGSLAIGSGAACPDWDSARPDLCGIGPTRTPTQTPLNTSTPTPANTATQTPTRSPSSTFTATSTRTATRTPTHSPAPTSTRTATRTQTFTVTRTPSRTGTPTSSTTPTRTSTPTRTATATATSLSVLFTVSGSVTYAGSGSPVTGAMVRFKNGATEFDVPTLVGGLFTTVVPAGTWEVRPYKDGDGRGAIDSADAQRILDVRAGLVEDSGAVHLASDVSGNGLVTGYDSALVLRHIDGSLATFPAATACNSDWAFIPEPDAVPNQTVVPPELDLGMCTPGAILYTPLNGNAVNQDFTAVLFGDANLDW